MVKLDLFSMTFGLEELSTAGIKNYKLGNLLMSEKGNFKYSILHFSNKNNFKRNIFFLPNKHMHNKRHFL